MIFSRVAILALFAASGIEAFCPIRESKSYDQFNNVFGTTDRQQRLSSSSSRLINQDVSLNMASLYDEVPRKLTNREQSLLQSQQIVVNEIPRKLTRQEQSLLQVQENIAAAEAKRLKLEKARIKLELDLKAADLENAKLNAKALKIKNTQSFALPEGASLAAAAVITPLAAIASARSLLANREEVQVQQASEQAARAAEAARVANTNNFPFNGVLLPKKKSSGTIVTPKAKESNSSVGIFDRIFGRKTLDSGSFSIANTNRKEAEARQQEDTEKSGTNNSVVGAVATAAAAALFFGASTQFSSVRNERGYDDELFNDKVKTEKVVVGKNNLEPTSTGTFFDSGSKEEKLFATSLTQNNNRPDGGSSTTATENKPSPKPDTPIPAAAVMTPLVSNVVKQGIPTTLNLATATVQSNIAPVQGVSVPEVKVPAVVVVTPPVQVKAVTAPAVPATITVVKAPEPIKIAAPVVVKTVVPPSDLNFGVTFAPKDAKVEVKPAAPVVVKVEPPKVEVKPAAPVVAKVEVKPAAPVVAKVEPPKVVVPAAPVVAKIEPPKVVVPAAPVVAKVEPPKVTLPLASVGDKKVVPSSDLNFGATFAPTAPVVAKVEPPKVDGKTTAPVLGTSASVKKNEETTVYPFAKPATPPLKESATAPKLATAIVSGTTTALSKESIAAVTKPPTTIVTPAKGSAAEENKTVFPFAKTATPPLKQSLEAPNLTLPRSPAFPSKEATSMEIRNNFLKSFSSPLDGNKVPAVVGKTVSSTSNDDNLLSKFAVPIGGAAAVTIVAVTVAMSGRDEDDELDANISNTANNDATSKTQAVENSNFNRAGKVTVQENEVSRQPSRAFSNVNAFAANEVQENKAVDNSSYLASLKNENGNERVGAGSGAGVPSYLESLPSSSSEPVTGSGTISYLDRL